MATKIIADFLNMEERPMEDTSVDSIELYEDKISDPETTSNPKFTIDYTTQWTLPSEAFLQMTGEIVKAADGSSYGAGDNVGFVNNGPLHLFARAVYKINNKIVEQVERPGEASLITSLVDYSDDYVNSMGEQLMIAKDVEGNNTDDTNTGFVKRKAFKKFDLCIPLRHFFGFARGVNKAVDSVTHTVELVKSACQNNALYRKGGVDAATVKLTGLSLWMPRVLTSPESNTMLLKFINSGKELMTPFQQVKHFDKVYNNLTDITWDIIRYTETDRPRRVFIAFRLEDKENTQTGNNGIFDPRALTDILLIVNGDFHPRVPYSVDFANGAVGMPYRDLLNYRGIDNKYDTGMLITKSDFLTRYPVYHFNLERMPKSMTGGVSTIQLKAKLNAGGNYRVHATVLADREMSFFGSGKRMNIKLR